MNPEPQTTPQVGDACTLAELEKAHIDAVIKSATTLGEAARVLGIDKATLYRKRQTYNIHPPKPHAG